VIIECTAQEWQRSLFMSARSNGTSWDMDPVIEGKYQSGYLRDNVSPWLALRKQLTQIPCLPFCGCFDYTQCPSEYRGISWNGPVLCWTLSIVWGTADCIFFL